MSVALRGISKDFGGLKALDDVDLEIRAGEIHALLGANGSGKSTLVRVATGVYAPDRGSILIKDRDVTNGWSPSAASAAGVRVVHQEAPLLDRLPISESFAIFGGYPRRATGNINWSRLNRETQQLLDELGLNRRSRDLAGQLTGAERALLALEIAVRSAAGKLSLLVLDEATAALPNAEAQPFLDRVRGLADAGLPVLMVTHRLPELAFADYVTVLDAGKIALAGHPQDLDRARTIAVMRGSASASNSATTTSHHSASGSSSAPLWQPKTGTSDDEVVLRVVGLSGLTLAGVDLEIRSGEIVGVVGPRGGGLDELPTLVAGVVDHEGTIEVRGQQLPHRANPRVALQSGVALLPADRLHDGGIETLSLGDNITLPDVRRFWHKRKSEIKAIERVVDYMSVNPPRRQAVFGRFSGGNQQKAILGRLLRMNPAVLVLADPTYGVDPAARETMFRAITDAKRAGAAILLTTTEPEQMFGLCDRVLVVANGSIVEELHTDQLTIENLMAKAI